MKHKRYLNALLNIVTSPYMLKGMEKYAFGLPFWIHRFIHSKDYVEIRNFQLKHKGERCFIIGTGPSLNINDLSKLEGEHCIGVNSIIKLLEDTSWKPDYYCITDPRVFEVIKDKIDNNPELIKLYPPNRINEELVNGVKFPLDCIDMYRVKARDVLKLTKFSGDASKCVYSGASVVYAALQLAVYMGFSEIYLLGVDCNYEIGKYFHNEKLEYNNDKYSYRDNEQTGLIMIDAFKIAREYAEDNNIKIYNASTGGMLEVFPRVNLEEVLNT